MRIYCEHTAAGIGQVEFYPQHLEMCCWLKNRFSSKSNSAYRPASFSYRAVKATRKPRQCFNDWRAHLSAILYLFLFFLFFSRVCLSASGYWGLRASIRARWSWRRLATRTIASGSITSSRSSVSSAAFHRTYFRCVFIPIYFICVSIYLYAVHPGWIARSPDEERFIFSQVYYYVQSYS